MKSSSIFCMFAIAASSLITLSSAALATSETKNISTNLESQSIQISERFAQANTSSAGSSGTDDPNRRTCNPVLDPLCGWW